MSEHAPLGTWSPPGGFDPSDNGAHSDVRPEVELTDLGNARLFAHEHGAGFRYVVPRRQWLVWRDGRWRRDEDDAVVRAAKSTVEAMLEQAILLTGEAQKQAVRHALASQSEPAIRRMLTLAATEHGIALTPQQLDRDPWLLSCANGVIDLRTGGLRDHDPDDLISLGSDVHYDPEQGCPRFTRFLEEIFDTDVETIEFVHRAIGYTLTGDTAEHTIFVCHGAGCNGKTTLLEIQKRLLGDLAATAAFETFARTRDGRSPRNDLARLHRARHVAASESGEGRRLDEATVKTLTGGDTITARFLYGEHFEFEPQFKIWLSTNHRPRVDGGDEAIWRRIRLIPFNISFRGREDRNLRHDLEAELPGILAWAVQGCLAWQAEGLEPPAAVVEATAEYRREEDTLGAFLTERCDHHPDARIEAGTFRDAYSAYCQEEGEKAPGASQLGRELSNRGIPCDKRRDRRYYLGIQLRDRAGA